MTRAAVIGALLAAACSLTTATGFKECTLDVDCAASSACLQGYCVRLPDGCTRAFGDFRSDAGIFLSAVLPLTDNKGTRDNSELAALDAYVLALEEMNQREGANGHKFAMYVCDTQRNTDRAKGQAGWMAEQLRVPVVITSGSQQTISIEAATHASGTMLMSSTSTSPELVSLFSASGGLVWRTAPPDTLQGRVLANLLVMDPTYSAATRIGIVFVDDPYGQGLSSELATRLMAAGRLVTRAQFTDGDSTSIVAAVARLVTDAVQVTVVIGFTSDTKTILTEAFTKPVLQRTSGHRWAFADGSKDRDILTVPGAVFELAGSLGTAPAQGAGISYNTFRSAYLTRFNQDPSDYSFVSHSYDAMYLLGLGASYATAGSRSISGRTMADAMSLFSSGLRYNLEPINFSAMRNSLTTGTSINVEGNSGALDFIPDAGAPLSRIEEWRIEADGGFFTVANIDPPPI